MNSRTHFIRIYVLFSLNWSRALDYCVRRCHVLSQEVVKKLSETEGILDVLLKILWSFPWYVVRVSNFNVISKFQCNFSFQ